MDILKISSYLPTVERFKFGLSFKEKLKWIVIFLSLYFFLLNIPLIGIVPIYESQNPFTILYSTLTGAKLGTLATLGISPLLTSSIVVQLLVASKIIEWDMKESEGRKKIKALENILSYLFLLIESIVFTYSLPTLIPIKPGFEGIVFLQILVGGMLVYLISMAIDRINFGSGLTLIIISGIVFSFFINLFSPFTLSKDGKYILWFQEEDSYPFGRVISLFVAMHRGNYEIFLSSLVSLISTFIILIISIFLIRGVVEIPLSFLQFRGFGRPFELSLFYTSTLPLIFGSALLATLNLLFLSTATNSIGSMRCGIFGCFDTNNNPIGGIAYYLTPPKISVLEFFGIKTLPEGITVEKEIIKTLIFFLFFTIILTIFSWIWVYSSGMDSQSIAESLKYYGFGVSGFRSDEKTIANILDKYIPHLTILSGILSAVIAITADILGSILHSTSLIILVSAAYNYYLLVRGEKSEDIPGIIRRFVE